MENERELSFDDEALAPSEGITLDIYSEEEEATRGWPQKETLLQQKRLEGRITLHPRGGYLYSIPSDEPLSLALKPSPDRTKWDLYLFVIPFTLHRAAENGYYETVTFFVELSEPTAVVFDLFPRSVTVGADAIRTYSLSPHMKVRLPPLQPTITVFEINDNEFYWLYKGADEKKEVVPETKHALFILQVPRGMQTVHGTIHYEVLVRRKVLGFWEQMASKTDDLPINWRLTEAQPIGTDQDQYVFPHAQQVREDTAEASRTAKDFFISYTQADKGMAEWIAWQLQQAGYSVILQAWDFRPGSNFVLAMHKAAAIARRTLLVLSPDYLRAPFSQSEWAAAFFQDPVGAESKIVPVRVRPCEPGGLGLLGPIVYIDLVDLPEEAARAALLSGVKEGRVLPPHSPTFPPNQIATTPSAPNEASLVVGNLSLPSSPSSPHRAVILTAIPVEYQAIQAHLTQLGERVHPEGTVYGRGKFLFEGGSWDIGLVEIGAGNAGAAAATERAIAFFKPHIVLFVGVAGGLKKKDVRISDVVAATKVYGYESGKAEEIFKTRPSVFNSSHRMEQRARAEARSGAWRQRIKQPLGSLDPKAMVGPIAAGEKVLTSMRADTWNLIKQSYGDALAVEMEGHGFLQAIQANHSVEALVIRGISDLVEDENKDKTDAENSQERAADHASAFAFEILAKLGRQEEHWMRQN